MARREAAVAISRHAEMRCQHRGIPGQTLADLLDLADRSVPVGSGCEAVSVSRKAAERLRRAGYPGAVLERLDGTAAILSPAGNVVTVLHATGRRYRRAWA